MEGDRGRRLTAAVSESRLGGWEGFRMGAGIHREKGTQRREARRPPGQHSPKAGPVLSSPTETLWLIRTLAGNLDKWQVAED